jgi:hypothetical protein
MIINTFTAAVQTSAVRRQRKDLKTRQRRKSVLFVSMILSLHLSLAANAKAQLPPPPPPQPLLIPEITIYDSVAPDSDLKLLFGDVTRGSQSDQMVTIKNDGDAELEIGNIAQTNQAADPFSILNDDCSMRNMQPSSTCSFTVRFSPLSTGSFNDTFDIPSNDSDENPVTITVSGNGLSSAFNNPPSSFALVYPPEGQRDLMTTVTFTWKKSIDPDGDAVTYDVHACEDINFTGGCLHETGIAFLMNKGVYYAGIAGNGTGLLLLAGSMLIVGIPLNRQRISFLISIMVITGVLLISCGSGGGGSSGGNAPENTGSISDEVSQTVSGLKSGTSYYWKVVARDSRGGESVSGVRYFETNK